MVKSLTSQRVAPCIQMQKSLSTPAVHTHRAVLVQQQFIQNTRYVTNCTIQRYAHSITVINSSSLEVIDWSCVVSLSPPPSLSLKAADFRKGYGNWRSKKSKGARGETNYLTDREKLHASDAKHEEVGSS